MTPITLSVSVICEPVLLSIIIDQEVSIRTDVNVHVTPVTDYDALTNKPQINGVVLSGNQTFENLGEETISNTEISEIVRLQYSIVFGGGANA